MTSGVGDLGLVAVAGCAVATLTALTALAPPVVGFAESNCNAGAENLEAVKHPVAAL